MIRSRAAAVFGLLVLAALVLAVSLLSGSVQLQVGRVWGSLRG